MSSGYASFVGNATEMRTQNWNRFNENEAGTCITTGDQTSNQLALNLSPNDVTFYCFGENISQAEDWELLFVACKQFGLSQTLTCLVQ